MSGCVYQSIKRTQVRDQELSPVKEMIGYWRKRMPRLGTRKLYRLTKPELEKQQIKLGRDGLFHYLKIQGLLIVPHKKADGIAAKKAWGEKNWRPCADIKIITEIDSLRVRGIRLKVACDPAGLGGSIYYKLRKQMKNQ